MLPTLEQIWWARLARAWDRAMPDEFAMGLHHEWLGIASGMDRLMVRGSRYKAWRPNPYLGDDEARDAALDRVMDELGEHLAIGPRPRDSS